MSAIKSKKSKRTNWKCKTCRNRNKEAVTKCAKCGDAKGQIAKKYSPTEISFVSNTTNDNKNKKQWPLICRDCNHRKFLSPKYYKTHCEDLHNNTTPFYCDECGKAYANNGSLDCHILKMHNYNNEMNERKDNKCAPLDCRKLYMLISGYIRIDKMSFCFAIIFDFLCLLIGFKSKYMDITISKEVHSNLGILIDRFWGTPSRVANYWGFDLKSKWYFNENECIKCGKKNGLKFVSRYLNDPQTLLMIGYAQGRDMKNRKGKINTYYNDCNEYKCSFCKYYIAHNIKCKYLEYQTFGSNERNYSDRFIRIGPVSKPQEKENINDVRVIRNMRIKCVECRKVMEITETGLKYINGETLSGRLGRLKLYCKDCELERFHFHINY